jgi:RNA polymerase sigma-70 factor, ECF subfamily
MSGPNLSLNQPQAFEQLYNSTHLQVFRFVYSLHGGPQAEVEDLTAETYLKAWRSRNGFSGDSHAALAWLFRIARNLVIDSYRRSRGLEPDQALDENFMADPGQGPEELYLQQEGFGMVWKALQSLPLQQREMIILRHMFNWPVKDIAAYLNMSENTISVNLRRQLPRLRKLLP